MTIFIIKIIACITMVLDHIKYVYEPSVNFVTLYLGRISFPLFAFLVTEGYFHTSNIKKYFQRLITFGIISQIPFMIFRMYVGNWMMLNIMFTLILGLMAILIFDKIENKFISIPLVVFIILCGDFFHVDYGSYGVLLIFILYLFKNRKVLLTISYIGVIVLHYYLMGCLNMNNIFNIVFTIFPITIILLYNGKQGKKLKYFYYWFYPVHMIIFDIIGYIF